MAEVVGDGIELFMVVPPLNSWDKPADRIMVEMGASSLGKTAGEAWFKHTRGKPEHVQHWFDKGYRLRRVTVFLKPEDGP
jgi:hypothetical protein